MKYHTIYKTTETKTGRYYIGKHTTTNLNDNYFGSGDWIRKGKKKNLVKKILYFCDTEEEAYNLEKDIVKNHINDPLNMNICEGGSGFDSRPKSEKHKRKISMANKKPKTGRALKAAIENFKKASLSNIGRKHNDKWKKKQSVSNKIYWGKIKNRPWQKKTYIIEGKEYLGLDEVMKTYNISMPTVYNRIKSKKYPNWTNEGRFKNGLT